MKHPQEASEAELASIFIKGLHFDSLKSQDSKVQKSNKRCSEQTCSCLKQGFYLCFQEVQPQLCLLDLLHRGRGVELLTSNGSGLVPLFWAAELQERPPWEP